MVSVRLGKDRATADRYSGEPASLVLELDEARLTPDTLSADRQQRLGGRTFAAGEPIAEWRDGWVDRLYYHHWSDVSIEEAA